METKEVLESFQELSYTLKYLKAKYRGKYLYSKP